MRLKYHKKDSPKLFEAIMLQTHQSFESALNY